MAVLSKRTEDGFVVYYMNEMMIICTTNMMQNEDDFILHYMK